MSLGGAQPGTELGEVEVRAHGLKQDLRGDGTLRLVTVSGGKKTTTTTIFSTDLPLISIYGELLHCNSSTFLRSLGVYSSKFLGALVLTSE